MLMNRRADLHVRKIQLDRRELAREGSQQQTRRDDHHAHGRDDVQGTLPAMWRASFSIRSLNPSPYMLNARLMWQYVHITTQREASSSGPHAQYIRTACRELKHRSRHRTAIVPPHAVAAVQPHGSTGWGLP